MSLAPSVTFALPDGARATVHPGGILGRLATAALRLDDPRVSEAHALVSLRGKSLVLLALRGAIGLRGRWLGEIDLRGGQRVSLAEGLDLEVVDLVLPDRVMVIESDEERVELDRPELSLSVAPLRAEPGSRPDAAAWAWCSGEQWWLQVRGERPRELRVGEPFALEGVALTARSLSLAEFAVPRTIGAGKLWPPLRIVCWPGHTEIHAEGRPIPLKLTRNAHSLIRETARLTRGGGSAHWLEVAERIWRFGAVEDSWYTNLARLRDKLREGGLPPDLIRCVEGRVELALRAGVDAVELREE